jgi:sugar/nucleoside kinase (ribokinase family)
MEEAMEFLAETDERYAAEKADLLRCEILAKRTRARAFLEVAGEKVSVEHRKAAAEAHIDVIGADDALVAATLAFESLKARRGRAEILIDVWRSIEASRRRV